jgi:hypothetical protein
LGLLGEPLLIGTTPPSNGSRSGRPNGEEVRRVWQAMPPLAVPDATTGAAGIPLVIGTTPANKLR